VLDMGKPVKIDDMARNLIRLSGYEPDKDIQIVYTGLRSGEKLYEELLMDEEGMQKTGNDLIYIGHPISFDDAVFAHDLEMLQDLSYQNAGNIEQIVAGIVPTYHPARNGERA
ncbi:MAG: polysaccharide biosynthesis protein, partial [Solobacterium sp.]|nr:polysaccharide biosynthesis protein [Solobacterium sp.]